VDCSRRPTNWCRPLTVGGIADLSPYNQCQAPGTDISAQRPELSAVWAASRDSQPMAANCSRVTSARAEGHSSISPIRGVRHGRAVCRTAIALSSTYRMAISLHGVIWMDEIKGAWLRDLDAGS
jgi:hypothetical protein